MQRIFDNPHNLSSEVILWRLHKFDTTATALPYSYEDTVHYVAVDSVLPDAEIDAVLNYEKTALETEQDDKKLNAIQVAKTVALLKSVTVADALAYIDANVTSLNTKEKQLIKALTILALATRDELWPNIAE